MRLEELGGQGWGGGYPICRTGKSIPAPLCSHRNKPTLRPINCCDWPATSYADHAAGFVRQCVPVTVVMERTRLTGREVRIRSVTVPVYVTDGDAGLVTEAPRREEF